MFGKWWPNTFGGYYLEGGKSDCTWKSNMTTIIAPQEWLPVDRWQSHIHMSSSAHPAKTGRYLDA